MSGIKEESLIFIGGWGLEDKLKDENVRIYMNCIVSL
jgi:hypothetical protein